MTFSAKKMTLDDKYDFLISAFKTLKKNHVVSTWIDFAQLLDVNRAGLSAAKNRNEKYLTASLIEKVADCLNEYNKGNNNQTFINSPNAVAVQGDNNQIGSPEHSSPEVTYRQKLVPTIPIKAYRAFNFDVMEYFRTTDEYIHLSPAIAQFPQMDCFYFVNSDDMSPNLQTNDLLCLSRLPSLEHITNGDLCILNTKQNGILERFVYNDGDAVVLKSTQPRWTDMRIDKKDIFSVFRILGGIRTNI